MKRWSVKTAGMAWQAGAAGLLLAGSLLAAGPSTTPDPVRQAAWNTAQAQAAARVDAFDAAVRSGNPESIRKAALDLQSDPIAVQKLNGGNEALIKAHNNVTGDIKAQAKKNICKEMANKWNAENPDKPPITSDDVEVYEPTNYKKPGAKAKAGQDWDVTVRIKGKDVPPASSKSAVEKGYFEAAGGKQTFGPDATPESAAHKQSVETTSGKSTEAYNEPEKILGKNGEAPKHGESLKDPEQLTKAIENKSHKPANEAAEFRKQAEIARAAGDEAAAKQFEVEAVKKDFEQMRQSAKQFDATTKPRVEAAGGKVNEHVEKGMEIIRNAASPEEARIKLAEMGETPESIINKASGQAEAAQKLKPPTDGPDGGTRTTADGPDGKPRVDGPDGGPRTTVDGPDGKPRVTTDTPDGPAGAGTTKAGKALEVVGKGMVAVDVLSGAKDAKDAIMAGDGKKLAEAGINVVDGFTGGAIGTTRTMVDRGGRAIETAGIGMDAQKTENEAADQRIMIDLRKANYSPEEIKAIMEAKAKGDEGPLTGAYEKLGKEVPKPVTVDFTAKEAAEIYVSEVGENIKEVGVGIKDKAVKAGTFVKEAGQDLHEIGSGLTEKGTRDEVITQVKENVSVDNLTAGWDARNLNNKADADRAKAVQDLADKLASKGIDPAEAKKAAEAFDKGDRSLLDSQVKQIKDAQAAKDKEAADKEKEKGGKDKDKDKAGDKDKEKGKGEGDKEKGAGDTDKPKDTPKDKEDGKGQVKTVKGGEKGAVKGEEGKPAGDAEKEAGEGGEGEDDRGADGDKGKGEAEDDGTPRNDAGQKVDPGNYGKGDTIVTKDGTEYVNKGGQWEKTGNNLGTYDPDGKDGKDGKADGDKGKDGKGDLADGEADLGEVKGDGGGKGTAVEGYTRGVNKEQGDKVSGGIAGIEGNKNLGEASNAGEEADQAAQNTLNEAGANAGKTRSDAATKTAADDRANSWGTKIGDAVAEGVRQGGEAFGAAVGQTAADRTFKKKKKSSGGASGDGDGDGDDGDGDDGDEGGDKGDGDKVAGDPGDGAKTGGAKSGGGKSGGGDKSGGAKSGGGKNGGGGNAPAGGKITVKSSGDASESASGGYAPGPQDKTISVAGKLAGKKITGVKVRLTYNAVSIPDAFSIIYEGASIAGSGSVSGSGTLTGKANGTTPSVTIRVKSSTDTGTVWDWSATATFYVEEDQAGAPAGAGKGGGTGGTGGAGAGKGGAGGTGGTGGGKSGGGGGGAWWKPAATQ